MFLSVRPLHILVAIFVLGSFSAAWTDPVRGAEVAPAKVTSAEADTIPHGSLVPCVLLGLDCPTVHMVCPAGKVIGIGTCWHWETLSCQTCQSIMGSVKNSCPGHACPGDKDGWLERADGCSAPGIEHALTQVFRAACNIHDVCYATPGRRKTDCDTEFLHNMKETCNFPGVPNLLAGGTTTCRAAANAVHRGVLIGGQESFDKAQEWAQTNCTPSNEGSAALHSDRGSPFNLTRVRF